MRFVSLFTLFALAACATLPNALPSLRYADAASRGTLASLLAGRPSAAQVERTTAAWSMALGDSFACGAPMRQTLDAGLVGALEIAAMNAASSGGGEREIRAGVGRYVGSLVELALDRRPRRRRVPGRSADADPGPARQHLARRGLPEPVQSGRPAR